MIEGDPGRKPVPHDWGFPLIGIIMVVGIAWGIGYTQARETEQRRTIARALQIDAKSLAQKGCHGTRSADVFECVEKYVSSGYEQANAAQELSAQQRAATSALLSTVIGLFTLIISIIGVWFVKRTLDATLKAVEDTSDATKAMHVANTIAGDTADRQLRAYLYPGPVTLVLANGNIGARWSMEVSMANTGATPATLTFYDALFEFCSPETVPKGFGGSKFKGLHQVKTNIQKTVGPNSEAHLSFAGNIPFSHFNHTGYYPVNSFGPHHTEIVLTLLWDYVDYRGRKWMEHTEFTSDNIRWAAIDPLTVKMRQSRSWPSKTTTGNTRISIDDGQGF